MLLNQNKKGEKIFTPIVSRGKGKNESDGGGLLLEGNPISSFTIETEARELVLGKWFHILGSLTDVLEVYFVLCDLGENRLEKLGKALGNLAHLSVLSLEGSQMSSLLPLKEVLETHTGLTHLSLSSNQITSLSGLETATGLTHLDLYHNQIITISGLAKLTGLTHLYLYHNQITDISDLAKLTGLTHLNLFLNQITDISGLAKLTGLTHLDLFKNQITNILPLQSLSSMKYLDLGSNSIKTVLPLQSLTHLQSLGIYNNPINKRDFNALRKKLPNVFKNCSATGFSSSEC
jgi:Leucine-rich repeat (LRR) protein